MTAEAPIATFDSRQPSTPFIEMRGNAENLPPVLRDNHLRGCRSLSPPGVTFGASKRSAGRVSVPASAPELDWTDFFCLEYFSVNLLRVSLPDHHSSSSILSTSEIVSLQQTLKTTRTSQSRLCPVFYPSPRSTARRSAQVPSISYALLCLQSSLCRFGEHSSVCHNQ